MDGFEGGGYGKWTDLRVNGVWQMDVENSLESHKPVEIGYLRAQGAPESGEAHRGA